IELHHREQVVLIGYTDRAHAGPGHRIDELGYPHHAVDERVFGVQPQVNELSHRWPWPRKRASREKTICDATARALFVSTHRGARGCRTLYELRDGNRDSTHRACPSSHPDMSSRGWMRR